MSASHAYRFIASLRAAAPGLGLDSLDDVEGFAAAVEFATDDLNRAMAGTIGGIADLARDGFVSAACDGFGRIVIADPGFTALGIDAKEITAAVEGLLARNRRSGSASDGNGRPTAIAVCDAADATGWPLNVQVRAVLVSGEASHAVLAFNATDDARWRGAATAYGLTGLEARISVAVARHDDLRAAAAAADVAYETAREAIESAMHKAGARRQADLIRKLTLVASGDLAEVLEGWRALADMFEFSPRQAKVAWAVGHGATRAEAAQLANTSVGSVKADLATVHLVCGTQGVGLGRLVGEIDALTRLATATDIETLGTVPRRLRFVARRRAPGRIAVEDHGPADWTAVVVFHSATNGRHLPGRLVRALHARRLRPISVERPGYGLTTVMESTNDPMKDAADDLIDVFDALGINRARLLGRSCVAALAFAERYPERVERGVLLGPSSPNLALRRRDGLLGAIATMAVERPALIEAFAALSARGAGSRVIERLSRQIVRQCSADIAALDDPETLADHIRATRQCAIGRAGLARELSAHARADFAVTSNLPWTILSGACDPMHHASDGTAWTATLPGSRHVVISDGGRLLHVTHAAEVATALVA